MKLALVGFGNAGGKVADRLLQYEHDTGRTLTRFAVAFNSARTDLARMDYVPEDNRILIGQTHEQVKGHGAGADPELGTEIARQDRQEIQRAFYDIPIHDVDAFLVVAGLGGGTGSGGAPVLARYLSETYEEPVYGLGIFPSEDEGGRAALNAARSFRTLAEATDNLLLFDNDAWRQAGDSVESGYRQTNEELAKRIGGLLSAGELDGSRVAENAMDASDIRRTLATGGVSTVAYAETSIESATRKQQGLLSRFTADGDAEYENGADLATKINGLIRQAVQSRLTCPADVASAERSLIVISGPPSEFSRKGLKNARRWLERRTGSAEVLAGDDPRENADTLSAVVLLSSVTDVPRVNRLQEQAVVAQENIEEMASRRQAEFQELITDEQDKLDPL